MRSDTLKQNGDRIAKAENDGETWRVVNDIINPKTTNNITIRTENGEISAEKEVAEVFNKYFVDKINTLKEGIDPSFVKDPMEKISEKVKNKNLKFELRPVTVNAVEKIMKQMKKKKSKGADGIPQECLLLGLEALAAPLTGIINQSITDGKRQPSFRFSRKVVLNS